jgi:hypothetical protein
LKLGFYNTTLKKRKFIIEERMRVVGFSGIWNSVNRDMINIFLRGILREQS